LDVLQKLKTDFPIILCKIEKNFPPAFFDVMVHLAVHLPEEAILRGPVQYVWMFPVERRLCTLKHLVRKQARPEGSIVEAYVANEALTFCFRYFTADDVATRFNQVGRNKENANLSIDGTSCFDHNVMVLSYQDDEIDQTLQDVILDDGLGDGSEVPVPITGDVTMVAATEVDAIRQQELSDVDGFNSEDEDDDTLWPYVDEDENAADESDDD
jgi:hypothetical protein